jgi:zinc protease
MATVVATQVWYHVGSAHEDAGSRGLAHLFEHLMFGDTATHGKEEYWGLHHRLGGETYAYTDPDETVYESEIPPDGHPDVLALEADRMRNLLLVQSNLDNEKKIVTEELRLRTENDPVSRLLVAAQKALLGAHPYAYDSAGEKEDVAAASLESCRRFYDAYYHPSNAHLVIAGPVDPGSTLALVERLFGPIPSGGVTPPEIPSLLGWRFPEEVDLREDLPPVEISVLAFPLPEASSEDRWAVEILLQLLSGAAVDPFREELVVRRGKALEAGAQSLVLRRGGAFFFYSVSLPYRRKATAFRLMEETRERLSSFEWLTAEMFRSAKLALLRAELEGSYESVARVRNVGREEWWTGDGRTALERAARIDRVSLDEVRDAWRKYLGDAEPVRLHVRPERVPLVVRLFGWLYPLVAK